MVIKFPTRTWTSVDANGSNRQSAWADGGVNDICPSGYGVPTLEEFRADTTQATTTTITNDDTAFSSFLKLPASGLTFFTNNDFSLVLLGTWGAYWTRTSSGDGKSYILSINPFQASFQAIGSPLPQAIRCIKS